MEVMSYTYDGNNKIVHCYQYDDRQDTCNYVLYMYMSMYTIIIIIMFVNKYPNKHNREQSHILYETSSYRHDCTQTIMNKYSYYLYKITHLQSFSLIFSLFDKHTSSSSTKLYYYTPTYTQYSMVL